MGTGDRLRFAQDTYALVNRDRRGATRQGMLQALNIAQTCAYRPKRGAYGIPIPGIPIKLLPPRPEPTMF